MFIAVDYLVAWQLQEKNTPSEFMLLIIHVYCYVIVTSYVSYAMLLRDTCPAVRFPFACSVFVGGHVPASCGHRSLDSSV